MSGHFRQDAADPAGPPEAGGPAIEWVRDGVLLVRGAAAQACDPSIIEAAFRVAGGGPAAGGRRARLDAGRTAVVLVPPLGQPTSRLARALAGYLPPGERGIILVSGGTAVRDNTGGVPAQVLADQLAIEVVAPDGPVLAIPDGSLFVLRSGARTGWWRFRPGVLPELIGPRYPAPAWQHLLAKVHGEPPPTGLVLDQVPAGLWLHAAGATDPGDLAYAAIADPWDLTLLVSQPAEQPVPVETVGEALAGLPPEVRKRTAVSICGPLSYSGADMGGADGAPVPGRVLAARLGEPVRCNTGLPMMVGDARQVAAVTAAGQPTWRPFAQQIRYFPAAETAPELVYWRNPAPRFAAGVNGVVALDRHWVAEVVEAGLWVRPALGPVGGELVCRLAADPEWCLVVLGDLDDDSISLPWQAAATLLRMLAPDARDRIRVVLPYNASRAMLRRAMRACRESGHDHVVHALERDGTLAVWHTRAASTGGRATIAPRPAHRHALERA